MGNSLLLVVLIILLKQPCNLTLTFDLWQNIDGKIYKFVKQIKIGGCLVQYSNKYSNNGGAIMGLFTDCRHAHNIAKNYL